MISDATALEKAQDALRADHERLHDLAGHLGSASDLPALAAALLALRNALQEHFRHEEDPGGLYDALGVCEPAYRERLSALVDEHFRMLALARTLGEQAKTEPPASYGPLRAEAIRFADLLTDHERREHQMAADALARLG